VEVAPSARKHGISDTDMHHAIRNALRTRDLDEDLTLFIGPDTRAALLEIITAASDEDEPVIIHAMKLRAKYAIYL
jgi:hypothetical protein